LLLLALILGLAPRALCRRALRALTFRLAVVTRKARLAPAKAGDELFWPSDPSAEAAAFSISDSESC